MRNLSLSDIQRICNSVKKLLLGDIKSIVVSARQGKMWTAGEAFFIDSAAEAYVRIERELGKALRNLIPFSLVMDKADFSELYEKHNRWLQADMLHRRYIWIIDPIDGIGAFRTDGNGNYCVSVMLFKGTSPVASFAYYPEYELDGAAGVIFESSEDRLGLFRQAKEKALFP
jgi:3'-phosphoadenosine 5'-phosphosulfate (PAPS) 3'-phosphatase